ncbi:zinc finger MYM-type protein 1-like [Melanaphis sacchari]|uniref:zinc finger MYM-type protein 1-like n=1 Tax=Melanaphis sacchari TaxID=742174 RepID=UPI000DC140E4|nr:zinc finger MYM-type protein 1-like [Melanaphis sacchari]
MIPFYQNILKYGNPGKGNTSYMSFFTYEQFIKIMAEKVITTIVEELKSSTYFSISVDSTPDISNIDQLSFVVRYVNSVGEPVERFLGFIENIGHKAEPIAETIFSTLNKHNIDIKFLRGQSYDNAANMSGAY